MAQSYLDFEPDYQFRETEAHDIIEFQLQGFRKDQLKVYFGSNGVLIVFGERPLDGTRWIRFRKEFNPPKECKANDIHAKLSSGILYITIPKQITLQVSQQDPLTPVQQVSLLIQDKEKQSSSARDVMTTPTENATLPEAGSKSLISRLKMRRKTAVKVVASVTVLSLLFTMLFYMFKYCAPLIMDV